MARDGIIPGYVEGIQQEMIAISSHPGRIVAFRHQDVVVIGVVFPIESIGIPIVHFDVFSNGSNQVKPRANLGETGAFNVVVNKWAKKRTFEVDFLVFETDKADASTA